MTLQPNNFFFSSGVMKSILINSLIVQHALSQLTGSEQTRSVFLLAKQTCCILTSNSNQP